MYVVSEAAESIPYQSPFSRLYRLNMSDPVPTFMKSSEFLCKPDPKPKVEGWAEALKRERKNNLKRNDFMKDLALKVPYLEIFLGFIVIPVSIVVT